MLCLSGMINQVLHDLRDNHATYHRPLEMATKRHIG